MKKIVSLILVVVMLCSFIPTAFASESDGYRCSEGQHKVVEWQHVENKNKHKGICTICHCEVEEECDGDPDVATCQTEGTCSKCGEKYVGKCVLDKSKTITQIVDPITKVSINKHKGTCKYCGKEMEEHCSGDIKATCTTEGTCAVCKGKYYNEHTYSYGNVWKYDETDHWYQCENDECTEISKEGKHGHDFEYRYTSSGHYQVCKICGYSTEVTKHTYAKVCSPSCSVCGYIRTNVSHSYSKDYVQQGDKHRKICEVCGTGTEWEACSGGVATCAEKAKCVVCGNRYGSLSTKHSISSGYKTDANAHWHYCDECLKAFTAQNHIFGAWSESTTDTTKQVRSCTICGFSQTDPKTWRTVSFYEDIAGTSEYSEYQQHILNGNYATDPGIPDREKYSFLGWWILKSDGKTFDREFNFAEDVITSDTKIYARWQFATYSISYKESDGSDFSGNLNDSPTKYTYSDTNDVVLKNGSKDGYTFKYWYNIDKPDTAVTKIAKGTYGDQVLYAKVSPIVYKVSLDCQGADKTGKTSVDGVFNTMLADLSEDDLPKKDNAVFGGYYSKPNGLGDKYYDSTGKALRSWTTVGDGTLYALWYDNIVISFDLNNAKAIGKIAPEKIVLKYGDTAKKIPSVQFTLDGTTFFKWSDTSLESKSSKLYIPEQEVSWSDFTESQTLYALWKDDKVIRFDLNDAGAVGEAPTEISLKYGGDTCYLPYPEAKLTGKAFQLWSDETQISLSSKQYSYGGWYPTSSTQKYGWDDFAKSTTLYAIWGSNARVVFDNNIPDGTHPFSEYAYQIGNKISNKPVDPKYAGYKFDAWYTIKDNPTEEDKWDFTSKLVSDNIALYANWLAEYYIEYDYDGGTADETNPSIGVYNMPVQVVSPTKDGNKFTGWIVSGFTDGVAKYGATSKQIDTEVKKDEKCIGSNTNTYFLNLNNKSGAIVKLKANWEQAYSVTVHVTKGSANGTVRYKVNDGAYQSLPSSGIIEGIVKSDKLTVDVLPNNSYYATLIKEDGTAVGPQNSLISYEKEGIDEDLQLSVKFELGQYNLVYDYQGGTGGKLNPSTAKFDDDYVQVSAPTKSGYVFSGWTLKNIGRNAVFGSTITKIVTPIKEESTKCIGLDKSSDVYFKNLSETIDSKVYMVANWEPTYNVNVSIVAGSSYGTVKYTLNGGVLTELPKTGVISGLAKDDIVVITATPSTSSTTTKSSYYARITDENGTNHNSNQGEAISYTIPTPISKDITIKVSFTTNPTTGDDSTNPMLWIITMASAGAGAVITILKRKTPKYNSKH